MLRPTKHSHPDKTVVNVATLILAHMRKNRLEEYEKLRRLVRKAVSGGEILFLPAINLLFLLGAVEYHRKNDVFEYTGV